jgi:coenzyme PQQ precursor peptide PqqA
MAASAASASFLITVTAPRQALTPASANSNLWRNHLQAASRRIFPQSRSAGYSLGRGFSAVRNRASFHQDCCQESTMKWTTPRVVEICVGMEINCYACAEL